MPHPPFVSCIIPTWNRRSAVTEAVESVLTQTYRHFECIVVDDGSTDGTFECLRARFPEIRIIQQERRGVSAARNRGVREAKGEWLAFLDSDDIWHADKLERQVEWIGEHPEYRICQTEEIWIRHGRRVNPMQKHRKGEGDCFERSLELCVISPSTVMLRRDLFDSAGGLDEDFPVCEDFDLWLRIACREKIGLVEVPLVTKYGGHADQLSRTTPVMDAYRIRAIEKILHSGRLSESQQRLALIEMERKCRIVAGGCRKRGKSKEAREWEQRLQQATDRFSHAAGAKDSDHPPVSESA